MQRSSGPTCALLLSAPDDLPVFSPSPDSPDFETSPLLPAPALYFSFLEDPTSLEDAGNYENKELPPAENCNEYRRVRFLRKPKGVFKLI